MNHQQEQTNEERLLEYYPALHRYCCQMTGNVWDGEDVLQDTMSKAMHTYVPQENTITFSLLCTMARNTWRDQLRKHKRAGAWEQEPSHQPLLQYADLQTAAALLVTHFTPQQAAMFVLKESFQYSLLDIATMCGTTEGAVKSTLFRMRSKLQLLQNEEVVAQDDAMVTIFTQSLLQQNPDLLRNIVSPALQLTTPNALMCAA
ncbi:sigma-70 family RNA polymerase sigma factor [Ectobacillus sp. JY-23]|uniref:sigma-70 family RNA polymerase sigma factor n=1 Tax=Ectobacillus sp. JY-23 TaxID=2933872 RepID=UPI001FF53029|nr:sigma-70 family RNA polymerase sigma factor [Ectobacillus sp. JY-23]UOY93018.1 sigma-70 family RNA polymerase sigma factor [Ectobacillus sp. JY-23]